MTPFLDCEMWEVKRFPCNQAGNRPISKVYWYNSLACTEFPDNPNDIQVPEFLIKNRNDHFLGGTVIEFCRKHVNALAKEKVFCMVEISDNEWAFSRELLLNFAVRGGHHAI